MWEEYQIRPGMRLCVQNLEPLERPVTYPFVVEDASPVGYMSYLSGTTSISMTDCHGVRHSIDNTTGECALCHLPGSYGEALTHPGEPLQSVGILVLPDLLRKMADGWGVLHDYSLLTLEGGVSSFVWKESLPPHVAMTAREVLACTLEGAVRQVFMEYKAMELLLSLMNMLDEKSVLLKGVSAIERDAAFRARDILLESLSEPPSLLALAKRVGMTHTRLSAVFQLLLGDTVFGYLREKRLERARHLLETPRQGVTETAYHCGFSSPSHFTRAFTQRYGITPSCYHSQCMRRTICSNAVTT